MKAVILCYRDADADVAGTTLTLRADVVFCGTDVPGGAQIGQGPEGNGVPITLSLTGLTSASYSNAVEDGCVAEASRLGLPTLLRTDVLLPTYVRGTL